MSRWTQRWGVARSLLIYYGIPWRPWQMRRFYGQFVAPGDLCFDIGAHVGNRMMTWLWLGADVVGVEPQPACFAVLARLYGSHGRVHLEQAAVGDTPGQATLHINEKNPTITTLSASWRDTLQQTAGFANEQWTTAVDVPVITLDDLIARYGRPKFCKIDVEGFETAVLRGLSQPLPIISFEFIPATMPLAYECLDRLDQLGTYRYNWSWGEQNRLQVPHHSWLSPKQMRRQLESMAAQEKSGDIYAQLA